MKIRESYEKLYTVNQTTGLAGPEYIADSEKGFFPAKAYDNDEKVIISNSLVTAGIFWNDDNDALPDGEKKFVLDKFSEILKCESSAWTIQQIMPQPDCIIFTLQNPARQTDKSIARYSRYVIKVSVPEQICISFTYDDVGKRYFYEFYTNSNGRETSPMVANQLYYHIALGCYTWSYNAHMCWSNSNHKQIVATIEEMTTR